MTEVIRVWLGKRLISEHWLGKDGYDPPLNLTDLLMSKWYRIEKLCEERVLPLEVAS